MSNQYIGVNHGECTVTQETGYDITAKAETVKLHNELQV